jgi:hypothetical protein
VAPSDANASVHASSGRSIVVASPAASIADQARSATSARPSAWTATGSPPLKTSPSPLALASPLSPRRATA